ncbi:hypothetical protein BJX76DRAFT_363253, partial [Aspergillus varians]
MESQLFEKIPSLRVIICRHCQYGVRPAEVEQHLKLKHQFALGDIHAIAQAIQQWDGIEQDSNAIEIPMILDKPLPNLPCYSSGLRCTRLDPPCFYVAASMESMRKHWRTVHHWSRYPRGGRISQQQQRASEPDIQQSLQCVSWQQVFPSKRGSHYIYIRFPDGRPTTAPPATQIQDAVDAMCTAWQEQQKKQEEARVIQAGQINDANPWLRMTRWAEYLQGIDPGDLLAISTMADPETDHLSAVEMETERGVMVLQATMAQLVRKSQQTVTRCSHAIRIEAVRTETSQTPYRPLLAYMHSDQIEKHVQPWQQVLGFIARTQMGFAWKGAKLEYGMTARQQRCWQRLWRLVQQAVDTRASPDPMDLDAESPPAQEPSAWEMTALETACLEFCIELLNQRDR